MKITIRATDEQWHGFAELMATLEISGDFDEEQEDELFSNFQGMEIVNPQEVKFDPPFRIELERFREVL